MSKTVINDKSNNRLKDLQTALGVLSGCMGMAQKSFDEFTSDDIMLPRRMSLLPHNTKEFIVMALRSIADEIEKAFVYDENNFLFEVLCDGHSATWHEGRNGYVFTLPDDDGTRRIKFDVSWLKEKKE